MNWIINLILGMLIGSFLACYVPAYYKGFRAVLGRLANKNPTDKKTTKKEK